MADEPAPDDIPDEENVAGGPIADKGSATAPMGATDGHDEAPGDTPGVTAEAVDALTDDLDPRELDLARGHIDDDGVTQGESVIEAEYADRGPTEQPQGSAIDPAHVAESD